MFASLLGFVAASSPLVIWHGMGDSCCDGIANLSLSIQDWYPGIKIHSIKLGGDIDQDRKASFFGIINEQVEQVCRQLEEIPELDKGFNALGFSQGGLFLRALVQKCPAAKVLKLITFGSPHHGTSDVPNCIDSNDLNCSLMRSIIRNGVYWSWVQNRVVQAQYFKQYQKLDQYLAKNIFLPELNDEIVQNKLYAERMNQLQKLILIKFEQDEMIVPKETAWFSFYNEKGDLIPLRKQEWYNKNSIGIKSLDENGKIEFVSLPGSHMKFTRTELKEIFNKFVYI